VRAVRIDPRLHIDAFLELRRGQPHDVHRTEDNQIVDIESIAGGGVEERALPPREQALSRVPLSDRLQHEPGAQAPLDRRRPDRHIGEDVQLEGKASNATLDLRLRVAQLHDDILIDAVGHAGPHDDAAPVQREVRRVQVVDEPELRRFNSHIEHGPDLFELDVEDGLQLDPVHASTRSQGSCQRAPRQGRTGWLNTHNRSLPAHSPAEPECVRSSDPARPNLDELHSPRLFNRPGGVAAAAPIAPKPRRR